MTTQWDAFPPQFVDDLKAQADIVQVVQDVVPLKKAGSSYKGLCPFHNEKTPSFHVNQDKGFFKCFGCGAGGDVVKFVELHEKLAFPEAVRLLAERFGVQVPESADAERDAAADARREALLKVHSLAAAWFQAATGRAGRPGRAGASRSARHPRRRRSSGWRSGIRSARSATACGGTWSMPASRPTCCSTAGWSWNGTGGGYWTASGTG